MYPVHRFISNLTITCITLTELQQSLCRKKRITVQRWTVDSGHTTQCPMNILPRHFQTSFTLPLLQYHRHFIALQQMCGSILFLFVFVSRSFIHAILFHAMKKLIHLKRTERKKNIEIEKNRDKKPTNKIEKEDRNIEKEDRQRRQSERS